jgi:hypothetical protein
VNALVAALPEAAVLRVEKVEQTVKLDPQL